MNPKWCPKLKWQPDPTPFGRAKQWPKWNFVEMVLTTVLVTLTVLALNHWIRPCVHPCQPVHIGDAIWTALKEETLFRGGLSYSLLKLLINSARWLKTKYEWNRWWPAIYWIGGPFVIVMVALVQGIKMSDTLRYTIMCLTLAMIILRLTTKSGAKLAETPKQYQEPNRWRFGILLVLVVVQGICFGISHLGNYHVVHPKTIEILLLNLPQLIGSVSLSFLAWRYGIRASIISHMINNVIAPLL